MRIAVEGCAHGELERIYEHLQHLEKVEGIKIDLLICCGDFQATRNTQDLACMAVSRKYRNMCSFYKYYSGEKEAPMLTIFIGGNHEASNYMQELGYGGWAAPNIYYLGYAGVVNIGGVRIAGLSGIYKSRDYMLGHYEKVPYTEQSKRSVYHIRNLEVFRLKQLSQPVDIMLSHDWPRGVTNYGDTDNLLRMKPFFKKDIEENMLGSKPAEELLHELKPNYWFAAHLHCKFAALIPHGPRKGVTRFLALDKCLPRRKYLQVLDLQHDASKPLELSYDLEWLTIVHLTNHLLSVKKRLTYMPGKSTQERWLFSPIEEEKDYILKRFGGNLKVPLNFSKTVTPFSPGTSILNLQTNMQLNPQTTILCERLGVDDPLALLIDGVSHDNTPGSWSLPSYLTTDGSEDMSQISLTEDEDSPLKSKFKEMSMLSSRHKSSLSLKRLNLFLPPPKMVLPAEVSEGFSSLSQESKSLQSSEDSTMSPHMNLSESKKTTISQTVNSEAVYPAKKFKRRNHALYTTGDCDIE